MMVGQRDARRAQAPNRIIERIRMMIQGSGSRSHKFSLSQGLRKLPRDRGHFFAPPFLASHELARLPCERRDPAFRLHTLCNTSSFAISGSY